METPTIPPVPTIEQEERPARWPTVIGVISLIYALGGLLCQVGMGLWLGLADALPEMWRGGITMPPVLRLIGVVQVILTLFAGVLMLTGAIGLLRRKRGSPGKLKLWAMVRITLILVSVVVAVLTAPAQIQIQRQSIEFQKKVFAEQKIKQQIPEYSDEELWRRTIISTGITAGVMSVYPLFLGLYLSRRKIADQALTWR